MSERIKFDWHLAIELEREASELIEQAMEKLHAAEGLYRMDQDTPTNSRAAASAVRSDYDVLAEIRHNTFLRYHERFWCLD